MADPSWKLDQAARDFAMSKGEEIAKLNCFHTAPVDPFKVIASESNQILAEGDDFRDSFDGRLSYHDGRFLLLYNTKYNQWPHNGSEHSKVRFTVAHELGHYYLDRHREFLVQRRQAIESFTEFESDKEVERQADAFAAGLLMPKYLVGPQVNCELDSTMESIKQAANRFDVSLTSMMVRWTQLSDFPCATLCVRDSVIQWGFASEAFKRIGLWRTRRNVAPSSGDAKCFVGADSSCSIFREGDGVGRAHQWLEGNCDVIDVQEFYLVIPYSRCVMVFLAADEDELPSQWDDRD